MICDGVKFSLGSPAGPRAGISPCVIFCAFF
jgi:hypothetical protein